MNDLPEITEVQRLRLEPGDALVVRLESEPSMQSADAIKNRVRAVLDLDTVPVLVLGPGVSLEVVDGFSEQSFVTWLKKQLRIGGLTIQGNLR